jgi:hypothetical protein
MQYGRRAFGTGESNRAQPGSGTPARDVLMDWENEA